ncbi:coniferyl aldehyde dehydrogenase [Pseudomonas syringae]|uniref:Aldehyde dehydrogenase n=3 Tax=Pseudomonas syringae TaxID=317 RepID=A0A9Q4A065_PSESX|nr:coniferyl aldehyde dehydrogenase [Pseudomonas syringae]MCF5466510.1 aldehyde dehydrogenase family protein [Pseudomonas syringae]MCF5471397.1 aldehyde dehydrogenase family protein [Pseudomonas syringae]MCF5482308.1 aldehyde dehydrogenase family protein [Pseudomonas syringae]MCF5486190.1 aldehyde dehydrogenase family protein [Pseudomonas syringae]MCF5492199.1 aldehyde dehydrogenase family protein [Pseudomonas syringae]
MNQPAQIQPPTPSSTAALNEVLAAQQAAIRAQGVPGYAQRIADLDAVLRMVSSNQDRLLEAVCADFGNRSFAETRLGELMPIINGIKHIRSHLKAWMRPARRKAGIVFRPASAKVIYQPLGVVGILAPWNYPLTLTLVPLIEALAAGNRVMIKPSELTPRTSELLRQLLGETFTSDQVAVVTGDAMLASQFSELPFDHLLFTGSTHIGRQVMAAAARNLTPVTLELGGKSPVVVCADFPLKKAARIIAIGKLFNAGQTCVAPDYVLVPRNLVDNFASEWLAAAKKLYPTLEGNPDYTSIISPRHYDRLLAMANQAVALGARAWQHDAPPAKNDRRIPPVAFTQVPLTADILQEEIFGPLLPILAYDTLDEAIAFINARPTPLALYCFSNQQASVDHVLNRTRSGGVTINGTMLHATQDDLPFGGVGESGTGAYHGYEGFIRLSHARSVLTLSRFNLSDKVSAPYGRLTLLVTRLMLRK